MAHRSARGAASHSAPPPGAGARSPAAVRVLGIAAIFGLGMLADRWGTPPVVTAPPASEQTACQPVPVPRAPAQASRRVAAAEKRPFLVRPVDLYQVENREAEQRYRTQQAHDLMGLLRARVSEADQLTRGANPEAAANQSFLYLMGWIDSVTRTAPDMVDELAAEVDASLCNKGTSPTELIVMSRVLMKMPELADSKGFDCLFSEHTSEDVVLWSALDAWRRSGLPKNDALVKIQQSATDERTLRRFLSPQEQLERRRAAAAEARESASIAQTESAQP